MRTVWSSMLLTGIVSSCVAVHYFSTHAIRSTWVGTGAEGSVQQRPARGMSSITSATSTSPPPWPNPSPSCEGFEPKVQDHLPQLRFIHIPKTGGSTIYQTGLEYGHNWWVKPFNHSLCHYFFNGTYLREIWKLNGMATCEELYNRSYCAHLEWRGSKHRYPSDYESLLRCSRCIAGHTPPFLPRGGQVKLVEGINRSLHREPFCDEHGQEVEYFSVLRHPVDRIVSEYRFHGCPGRLNDFIEQFLNHVLTGNFCVKSCHFMPQFMHLLGNRVQHLMLSENVDSSLHWLSEQQGIKIPKLKEELHTEKANLCHGTATSSTSKLSKVALSPKSRWMIEKLYSQDLQIYNMLKKGPMVTTFRDGVACINNTAIVLPLTYH